MFNMRALRAGVLALFVMTGVILGGCALQQNASEKGSVVVSHLPAERERLSADYVVEVNGQDIPVYTSAVSPDVQEAPLNLNELYSFAGFECSGVVEVTIRSADPLTELSVRSVHQRGDEGRYLL